MLSALSEEFNAWYFYLITKEFIIGKQFKQIKELFENKSIRLDEEINYTYGDIISMFLKDGVKEEGFACPEFREFLRVRFDDFSPDFIIEHGFIPAVYKEKYIDEIKILRK